MRYFICYPLGMLTNRESVDEAVENILRLRRAEERADPNEREELARAREFLERIVGATVRPTDAARLLGISKAALSRWLDRGEVATVLTPRGRREVPLGELIDLLEEVEEARLAGWSRALAHVLRERNRRAHETVDIDRLVPRGRPRTHRTAELQSLAYHRLVAERLDERIVEQARRRLGRWQETDRIDPRWARAWEELLAQSLPKIARTIAADTRQARALRQTSPFAGLLTEQERRLLGRAVEERTR
jgi:hypothetical protein